MGIEALAYLFLLLISAYLWTLFFRKRLGGVTGDVFGFQSEISEVIFLLLIIIKYNRAIL
jgi:cobalamin synthase